MGISCRSAFFGFAEFGDDGEVFEGGDVPFDFTVGGEFAKEAAHDLATASFGERFSEADVVGAGEGADLFGDPFAELVLQVVGGLVTGFEGDESGDGLTFEVVGAAYDGGFSDFGMGDKRGFDLHGAETVSADVDDVVN